MQFVAETFIPIDQSRFWLSLQIAKKEEIEWLSLEEMQRLSLEEIEALSLEEIPRLSLEEIEELSLEDIEGRMKNPTQV